jgi:hypothetical protein
MSLLPTITISTSENFKIDCEHDQYTADCSTTNINRHSDPMISRKCSLKNKQQPNKLVISVPYWRKVVIPNRFRMLFDCTWYEISSYKHIVLIVGEEGGQVLFPGEIKKAVLFNLILPEIAKKYNIPLLVCDKISSFLFHFSGFKNDYIYIKT